MMDNENKIPTTIFTGFLGSGKTTIISHLIDYLLEQKVKVAYVKNEIGSLDIDGKLIKGKNIETKELLNGCICCTLTGPFYFAISELVEKVKPDRIIIEASGVASPAAIALLVSSHQQIYRDGLITIIDVVNFDGYKDLSLTAKEQAKLTDLIVFNKVELVNIDRLQAVVGYIRELNEYAPIVESTKGILDPILAFGLDTKTVDRLLAAGEPDLHDHLKTDKLETFNFHSQKSVVLDNILTLLDELPQNIIRVKGIVKTHHEEIYIVNKVGTRVEFKEIKANNYLESNIVFIGFDILSLKNQIIHKFENQIN
jgi:G3E family GTPase